MTRPPILWPDEIPSWLRMPGAHRLLFGPVEDLERHAAEHGHPLPTLLELDEARRLCRARRVYTDEARSCSAEGGRP